MRTLQRSVVPVVVMIVIWVLSSLPSTGEHTLQGIWIPPFIQKGGHAIAYAALAAAWWWALVDVESATPIRILMLCIAYGAANEIHQLYVPGRTAALLDVAINGVGAAAALLALSSGTRSRVLSVPRAG